VIWHTGARDGVLTNGVAVIAGYWFYTIWYGQVWVNNGTTYVWVITGIALVKMAWQLTVTVIKIVYATIFPGTTLVLIFAAS
jgi:hypothetical protein